MAFIGKMIDDNTGLELYPDVDPGSYYFDMVELEAVVKAQPGGNGRWIALNAQIQNNPHMDPDKAISFVTQKWLKDHPV